LDALKASVVAAVLAVPGAFVASSYANGGWLDAQNRRQGQSANLVARVRVFTRKLPSSSVLLLSSHRSPLLLGVL
jgi:hypothetical protein